MEILFIYPGITLPGFNSLRTKPGNESCYVSHGLMAMSAILKQRGHAVSLLDLRDTMGWPDFERRLAQATFDVGAIGFLSCDVDTARTVCSIVKRLYPDKPIIAGGLHLTATHTKEFPYVDCVVHGEGDYILADLIDQYQTTGALPPFAQAEIIKNLDDLPFVDRSLFEERYERQHPLLPGLVPQHVTIITTRGCPWRCRFCSPSGKAVFGSKLRERSVGNVMAELSEIRTRKGPIHSVMFHSDLLGGDKWIEDFVGAYGHTFDFLPFWCQLRADFICKHPDLIKAMSEVGMYWVSLGLESGCDEMLKFLCKGTTVALNIEAADILHRNGVNIFANLICGVPTETEAQMRLSLAMAEKIKPAWWSANPYAAFPGSDLYAYCVEHDLLTDEMYSKTVYPYQRKIKGLDYGVIMQILTEIRRQTRPVVPVKKN